MNYYKEVNRKSYYPVHQYSVQFTALYPCFAPYNDWIEEVVEIFDTDEESAIDTLRKEYGPFFMALAILDVKRSDNNG